MMKIAYPKTIFVATAMLLMIPAAVSAQVSSVERAALIEFYNETGGESWKSRFRWLNPAGTECEWRGITCGGTPDNRYVLRIQLWDNNLVGELPDVLGAFEQLASLSLADNQLRGSLPANLWGLSSLEGLNLSGNELVGTIPGTLFHQPTEWVDLSGNQFSDYGFFSSDLIQPTDERNLFLANNRLVSLPPSPWRRSGQVTLLDLSGNPLEKALDFAADPWPGLTVLKLNGVGLTSILGLNGADLPDLIELEVADNELEHWPINDPAPVGLERIKLGHNQISELPQSLAELSALAYLELNDNRLSGPLPPWFGQLQLVKLNLNNNQLTGPINEALAALDFENFPKPAPFGFLGLRLHVANNPFSGALPADLDYASFNSPLGGQSPEFGLDLCFTDIELPDADTLELIDDIHRGWALAPCLGRQRVEIDPTVSGSWYNVNRAGEGVTQMLLDNGQLLTYWFTYPSHTDYNNPSDQMWLFETTSPDATWSEHQPLWITSGGRFAQGFEDRRFGAEPSPTWIRQDRVGDNQLHFFYRRDGGGLCNVTGCLYAIETGRHEHAQLSRLAGTTCDNQRAHQWISGAWYSPARNGEGFMVEVIEDGRGVVYWFTFQPDGSGGQAWMVGDAIFDGTTLHIDNLLRPVGTQFGPNFNAADVDLVHWGTLTLDFHDDQSGQISYDSVLEGFGSGSYPIERLARPMLADCATG